MNEAREDVEREDYDTHREQNDHGKAEVVPVGVIRSGEHFPKDEMRGKQNVRNYTGGEISPCHIRHGAASRMCCVSCSSF